MKKVIFLTALLAVAAANINIYGQYRHKSKDKYGFTDNSRGKGKVLIPYMYDDAREFSEGLAAVKLNKKWGFIDINGTLVIPHEIENVYSSFDKDGLAEVDVNGRLGFIDKTGYFYRGTKKQAFVLIREKEDTAKREIEALAAKLAQEKEIADKRARETVEERQAREKEEEAQREREALAARQAREREEAAQREREALAARQAREREETAQKIKEDIAQSEREALARQTHASLNTQEREEAAIKEAERIAIAKAAAEAERKEAERKEVERIAAAKAETEKIEAERKSQEKEETAKREREALAARQAQEKEEAARKEAERIAAAKAETEKIEAERKETERIAAAKKIIPKVSIVNPINRSTVENEQVRIVYDVSETIPTSIRVSVDGRPVQLITDAKLGENTVMVDVPDKDFNITIVAQNEAGASVPAAINLIRKIHVFKPSLYILAIGISDYDDPELRLRFAAKDASDFTQALVRQGGQMYNRVRTNTLFDGSATAENIRDGLSWLQTETTSRDIAMIYIAGHGVNDNFGDFFFMPVNADKNRINATCVSYTDIKRTTLAVAGKMIVFIDACHSGNVLGNTQQRAAGINQAVSELTGAENGAVVFTSSTGRQFSLEDPEWNNGAFTKALVEGLTGKADMIGNKLITINSLGYYISTRVKELTSGRQAPTTIIPRSIQDFPIAFVID